MSLDQNLFTLHVTQHKDNPHIVDLVDPSGTIHYRKHRLPGNEYKAEVYDPISQSLLITASSPTATSKAKTLELYNPTILVDLKYTGTLSFRWSFKWEEHDFEWKREECFMLRKPDPPVLVAVTKEPAGRLKTTTVQILDYNLNRFDIDDRKGLEIVILTALLTFSDVNEGYHSPQATDTSRNMTRTATTPPNVSAGLQHATQLVAEAPPPPPKPAPKTGVDRIAEMQAALGEYNEITVGDEGEVDHYAEYCSQLLEDDAMLFVTIRSAAAEQVPKVLQVVEQTKRIRHKAGLSEESELHQYVVYDTGDKKKGPRRINLDDSVKPATTYTPPTSLTVHMSKIDMPELQPRPTHGDRPSGGNLSSFSRDRDSSSHNKDKSRDSRKKEEKKASKPTTPPVDTRTRNESGSGKHSKQGRRSSSESSPVVHGGGYAQAHAHVHARPSHQSSPSQLNNPTIYTPPPPVPTESRPQGTYKKSRPSSPPLSFPTPTLGTLNTGWENSYPSAQYSPGGPYTNRPTTPNSPYPTYNPPAPPQSYLPPPSHPQHHQQVPSRPSSPSTPHKTSLVTGLLDSFRRR